MITGQLWLKMAVYPHNLSIHCWSLIRVLTSSHYNNALLCTFVPPFSTLFLGWIIYTLHNKLVANLATKFHVILFTVIACCPTRWSIFLEVPSSTGYSCTLPCIMPLAQSLLPSFFKRDNVRVIFYKQMSFVFDDWTSDVCQIKVWHEVFHISRRRRTFMLSSVTYVIVSLPHFEA